MGSERINRKNQTKKDSVLAEANQFAKAWINAVNPLSSYTNALDRAVYAQKPTAQTQQPVPQSVETSPESADGRFNVAGVLYEPDGTPYNSPRTGYSIDQYGRPIQHSHQSPGEVIRPVTPSDTTAHQTPDLSPVPTVETASIGSDRPSASSINADSAPSNGPTWASIRNLPVTDSTTFFNSTNPASSAPSDGYSAEDSALFGRSQQESDAIESGGFVETLITPDGIGESTITPGENPTFSNENWSQAKARAAAVRAFLDSPAGGGAIGPLAAAEAAVGVARGGDKDGSYLNLTRDGKTYQIRGSQRDMATAAYRARGGENIFGDYDFQELPQ